MAYGRVLQEIYLGILKELFLLFIALQINYENLKNFGNKHEIPF